MSFEEKSNYVMLAAVVIVYGWYAATIASLAADIAVADIAYQPLMLIVVVPLVLIAIVWHAVIAALNPAEAGQRDERDDEIDLRAKRVSGYVVGTALFAGLVITMLEIDNFWIAQTLLGGLVLSEVVEGSMRATLYRRGV